MEPGVPHRLGAAEAAVAIARGEVKAVELMASCLERIAGREPLVEAFQSLDPAAAMEAAEQADRSERRGPLHGVPFAAKDIIDTADFPTGWGSPVHVERRPGRDASCIQLMKDAAPYWSARP